MFTKKVNKKKVNKEDLNEIRQRVALINQQKLIVDALENQFQIYLKNLMPKYNMDMNKNYKIDFQTGSIIETKNPVNPNKNKEI